MGIGVAFHVQFVRLDLSTKPTHNLCFYLLLSYLHEYVAHAIVHRVARTPIRKSGEVCDI